MVTFVEDGEARHGRSVLAELTGDRAELYFRRFGGPDGSLSVESRELRRYDLILVAAKSVSVLWAVSRREPQVRAAVEAAQEAACEGALAYLQEQLGGGLLAALFDHRYNSAKDPEVHTHAIIMPVMGDGAGRHVLVDGIGLFLHFPAAAALYAATYRAELTRSLEAEWAAPDDAGVQELTDVPAAVVQECSKPALPLTQVDACR